MIHSSFIQKVCRGDVSDAFKGQFVLPISALQGTEERKKKQLSEPNRDGYTSLCLMWHLTMLIIHHSSHWGGGVGAVFLEKEERRRTLQPFPANSLDLVMGRFHHHENGGCDLCPLQGSPAAFQGSADTVCYHLTPLLSEDRSAQVCAKSSGFLLSPRAASDI